MGLHENLWNDNLSQVELREPVTVGPDVSAREALEIMRKEAVGCILVCEGDTLSGIFTERDLLKRIIHPAADVDVPIRYYMTPDPVTVRLTEPIGSVIRTMYEGGYRHIPVMGEDDHPIGIVSVKRVVQYLVDHFPAAVYNLPPTPRQVQEAREGA